jgi:hypothetical protein
MDHHDCIFLRERCRIVPTRVFVELRTTGDGPRCHEAPDHAAVLELVSDGVYMVWAGFLEGLLKWSIGGLV